MPKITDIVVERTRPEPGRDVFLWDDALKGFGLRVKPSGVKSYVVQYRDARGKTWRVTIGKHGSPWTAAKARGRAKIILGKAEDARAAEDRADKHPAAERKAKRAEASKGDTLRAFAKTYLAEVAEVRKKASTVAEDRRNLDQHILPALGSKLVADLAREDVARLHHAMRERPTTGNRCRALLSHMMNIAEEWGLRPQLSNPCRGVKKYPERSRERFLTAPELAALGDVLAESERTGIEPASALAAVRLLLFTGARRNEILDLRWEHVDAEAGCLRLPDSKTGAKTIQLSAPALEVLSKIEREDGNPHVIRGRKARTRLVGLNHIWLRFRDRATVKLLAADSDPAISGLVRRLREKLDREPTLAECRAAAAKGKIDLPIGMTDVRLHDLRHTAASVAVGLGEGLPVVGRLLGHRQASTTQKYAHLADDPVKRAAERIGAAMLGMMNGGKASADVVPIGKRG